MSNPNDYRDRQFDVAVLQSEGSGQVPISLFGDEAAGQVFTGIYRLVQSWLMRLLTIKGSMPYLPDEGCEFLQDAMTGRWYDEESVRDSFEAAALEIARQFENEQEELTEDEQLDKAELTDVAMTSDGKVSLYITISSKAGESRSLIAPLRVSPIVTG